jgi:dynamin 1-like protein
MARQVDPEGKRTIGVITKIDIMDRGTNAKKMIMGNEVELKLGYVGIKNRS